MDRRTREARLLKTFRKALVDHCGGSPSAAQAMLIERAAQLQLHLSCYERKFVEQGHTMTEHDSRVYLAWSNTLSRILRHLGLEESAKTVTLEDYLAASATSGTADL